MALQRWIFPAILIILSITSGISCLKNTKGKDNQAQNQYSIEYEVWGTAENVDITYIDPEDGKSKNINQGLPWSIIFSVPVQDMLTLSLSAKAGGLNAGTVTSTIIVNQKVLGTAKSSGPLANATVRDIIKTSKTH